MKPLLSICLLLLAHSITLAQKDSSIYGLITHSSPYDIYLARISPATGQVTKISSSLTTGFNYQGSTIDTIKKVYYFSEGSEFIGIRLTGVSGSKVSHPHISNTNGDFFEQFRFNASDSTIYGIASTSSPAAIYLAKIDPLTGVVTNISASLGSSYVTGRTTIDPFKRIFYFVSGNKFMGVSLDSGSIVSDPVISNSNGDYFHGCIFNAADSCIYGLARKVSPGRFYLAKIDPSTGIVSNISGNSIASAMFTDASTIDPLHQVFYFMSYSSGSSAGKFTAVDMLSGDTLSNPQIVVTDGDYFLEFNYSGAYYAPFTSVKETPSTPEDFTVYPNPSNGTIHIKSRANENILVEVWNSLGQCVYHTFAKADKDLDLSDLKEGMYFITMKDGKGIFKEKLILSR